MSTTFEPREVDKPFVWRWLKLTLELFVRSPIRFGLLIALLGSLDTSAVMLTEGHAVQKAWIDRLGIVVLPFLWMVVSAVARGADDSSRTREGLAGLTRMPAWRDALTVGLVLAALNWAIASTLRGLAALLSHQRSDSYLQHQGQLLNSLLATIVVMIIVVGLCYFPLLVLARWPRPFPPTA